jgi:hypothetical protein
MNDACAPNSLEPEGRPTEQMMLVKSKNDRTLRTFQTRRVCVRISKGIPPQSMLERRIEGCNVAKAASQLVAQHHRAGLATTECDITHILLNNTQDVVDRALLRRSEVKLSVPDHHDILVMDEWQLATLLGIVVVWLKLNASRLAFSADVSVTEHEVNFVRLPRDLIFNKDATNLACVFIERTVGHDEGDLPVEVRSSGRRRSDLFVGRVLADGTNSILLLHHEWPSHNQHLKSLSAAT